MRTKKNFPQPSDTDHRCYTNWAMRSEQEQVMRVRDLISPHRSKYIINGCIIDVGHVALTLNLLWFFAPTDIMQKQVIFEYSAAEPFKMSMMFWLLLNLLRAHGGKSIHGVSMLRWYNYKTFDNNNHYTVKEIAVWDQQIQNQIIKTKFENGWCSTKFQSKHRHM